MSVCASEPGKPLRVLLVEVSENDAVLLLRELRRGGYEPLCRRVDTPEAMEAALRDADERGEPWDVVISDYYMPRFRGPRRSTSSGGWATIRRSSWYRARSDRTSRSR